MVDFNAPSSIAAIKALKDGKTRVVLFQYACWFTLSEDEGDDLLHEAILVACDPQDGRPWDPKRGSFLTHMRVLVHDLGRHLSKLARLRYEELDPDAVRFARSQILGPEEALSHAEDVARLQAMGAIVVERLRAGGDDLALSVFELACEGIDRPAEQAERLGRKIEEINLANERIRYHAARVRAETEASEASRKPPPPRGAAKKKGLPS